MLSSGFHYCTEGLGIGVFTHGGTVISEPAAIAAFIEAKAGGAKRIGLETGPTATRV